MSYQRDEIEGIVRQVVTRTLGSVSSTPSKPGSTSHKRPVLDADAVNLLPARSNYAVAPGTIITPLAREAALERGIRLSIANSQASVGFENVAEPHVPSVNPGNKTIALGADHGGYS